MESGRKLETDYNIIGRILEVMVKKSYIEVLGSSKGLLKGKGLDSIAMEICEMINYVEHLKEPVQNSIIQVT
jgi:hypothetical protein